MALLGSEYRRNCRKIREAPREPAGPLDVPQLHGGMPRIVRVPLEWIGSVDVFPLPDHIRHGGPVGGWLSRSAQRKVLAVASC